MLQHQLPKNCFREPLARVFNASLMRHSFAVTYTHQRTEGTVLDKVIYELFGFVSNFYKCTAPQSMSVCQGSEKISPPSLDNWGRAASIKYY